jgi:hypothetical protein
MALSYLASLFTMIGKVLLWLLDVPDHLTHHIPSLDRAKLAAVGAARMGANYEDFIRVYRVYVLDHRPILGLPENDGISPFK